MAEATPKHTTPTPHADNDTGVNEYLYRTLARNFPNGTVVLFDHELRHIIADGKGLADVGLTSEIMEGKTLCQVYPQETCRQMEPHYRAALNGKDSVVEFSYADRVFRMRTLPVPDDKGGVRYGMGMTQDVTDHIEAEYKLKRSKEFSEKLVASMLDGLSVLDAQGKHIMVNDAFCQMTGFARDELIGVGPPHPYWPPEQVENIQKVFEKVLDGQFHSYELVFRRRNGERFPVIVSPSQIRDEENGLINYFATVKDISEHQQADEKLRQNEELLNNVFESMAEGILVLGKDFRFTYFNKAMEKTSETPREQVLGHVPWQKFPFLKHEIKAAMQTAMQGNSVLNREFHYQLPSGTEGWTSESFLPLRNTAGEVTGIAGVVSDITDRKHAEASLRQAEAKFRCLVEQSITGIYIIQDGVFKYVNPKFAEIFGYSVAEVIDSIPFQYLVHEQDRSAVQRNISERIAGKRDTIHYSFRGLRKDGQPIQVEVHGSKASYQDRPAVIGMLLDISERRRFETALTESEEKFRTLAEFNGVGIWQITPAGKTIYANKAMSNILGVSGASELQSQTFHGFFSPDSLKVMEKEHDKRRKGDVSTYEADIVCKDGARRNVIIYGAPYFKDGDIHSFIGTFVDITEKKQAEQALRDSEERLEFALRGADLGLWDWNVATGEVTFNERWAEMLGYSLDQIEPHISTREGLVHPEDLPRVKEMLNAHLDGETPIYETEHRMKTKTGTWRWILDRGRVFERDEQGKAVRATGTHLDITDRKETEAQIRKLNQDLEERVSRRTAELEAANKELEAFAYSVAHDLRTPLRAINGFSQALVEDYGATLEGEALGYLERVCSASTRMAQLIDELLELSRVTRATMSWLTVDMSRMAREIIQELQQAEPERVVKVMIEPDLRAPGDPTLLRVALSNLLGNAWKFTAQRNPACIDFIRVQDPEPAFLVRDNGVGFDMAYSQKLFGVFQRLHGANEFDGTGIGLATVQRILHRHGGAIWAEAEPDKGSKFYFTLR